MYEFNEIMGRLKQYFEVSTNKKVGELLDLDYNTLKSWSSKKKVVIQTLLVHLKDKDINITWLLTGKGSMRLNNDDIAIADMIESNKDLQTIISLISYAPDEFVQQIIKRLEQFKEMSKI